MAQQYGAAARLSEQYLGVRTTRSEKSVSVGTSRVEAAPQNPDRIELLIINTGTTDITLVFGNDVVAGSGILLLGNGAQYVSKVREDGDIVGDRINAIGSAVGGSLWVVEVFAANYPATQGG